MAKKLVNNWECANELHRFKVRYLDPHQLRVDEAMGILADEKYKWAKGQQVKAKAKYRKLDAENIDNHRLYSAVFKLIQEHESLVDELTEIYAAWYHNISTAGVQPKDLMGSQVELLQQLFTRLHSAIEPLKLEIEPPKKAVNE